MKEYVLPFRDFVVHPGLTVPIYIDNSLSVACIEAAMADSRRIVLTAQHSWNYPNSVDDIYDVGTIGDIAQVLRMPDGAIHAIVRTTGVVSLHDISVGRGLFTANVAGIECADDDETEQTTALRDRIAGNLQAMASSRKLKIEKLRNIIQNYPLPAFVDAVVQMADIDTDTAIAVLRATSWQKKLEILLEQVNLLAETAKIEDSINRRIHQQMESGRREAILQEKMRAIQKEMGEDADEMDAINMRRRIESAPLTPEVREKAMSEWRRMRSMAPMSNDAALLKA